MGHPKNPAAAPPHDLDAKGITNSIVWMLKSGITGEKAAENIRDLVPNGHETLLLVAGMTPESIIEIFDSDQEAQRAIAPYRKKLRIFLAYFIARAKEITGRGEAPTQ